MEQSAQNHPEVYDFRQYDRIWQRVAPTLEPYPSPGRGSGAQQESAEPASRTEPAQAPETTLTPAQVRQESTLPGAERNPCCMGSAAAEMLEVLTGFVEEELADQRYTRLWPGRRLPGPGSSCGTLPPTRAATPGG